MIVESTTVSETVCACCETVRTTVTAYVSEDGTARAAVLAYCYPPHGDEPSAIWVDAILGTWGADDHATASPSAAGTASSPARPTTPAP